MSRRVLPGPPMLLDLIRGQADCMGRQVVVGAGRRGPRGGGLFRADAGGVACASGLRAHADVCDLCQVAGSADLVRAPGGWREAGHQACLGVTRWPAIAAGGVSPGLRTDAPTYPDQPLCWPVTPDRSDW